MSAVKTPAVNCRKAIVRAMLSAAKTSSAPTAADPSRTGFPFGTRKRAIGPSAKATKGRDPAAQTAKAASTTPNPVITSHSGDKVSPTPLETSSDRAKRASGKCSQNRRGSKTSCPIQTIDTSLQPRAFRVPTSHLDTSAVVCASERLSSRSDRAATRACETAESLVTVSTRSPKGVQSETG